MTRRWLLVALACAPLGRTAAQEGRHLLIVTGLSGEAQYAQRFTEAARQLHDSARTRWGVPDSMITWLGENPALDARRIGGRSTRESIGAALTRIGSRARAGDVVMVVLIGHGSGQGESSAISVPGPDATAADLKGWLAPLDRQRVVVVVAASGSGDYLPVLSSAGRVIITATRTAMERNESVFAAAIARGLATDEGDGDKDGSVTVLEAYTYARTAVAESYRTRNAMLTEHAMLDDDGDGKGTAEPKSGGGDGAVASRLVMAMPRASDPRVATLTAERRALEVQVEQLRARKAATDSVAYERELERLLLAIAAKTRDIRALAPAARP